VIYYNTHKKKINHQKTDDLNVLEHFKRKLYKKRGFYEKFTFRQEK